MPTLNEYNIKIARLKNTRKLTSTMKLVSANKLRRAQQALGAAQDYARRFEALIGQVRDRGGDPGPLAAARREVRRVRVVLFTSDRGLCGGFNNNLCKHVLQWAGEAPARAGRVELNAWGQRGFLFFRNQLPAGDAAAGLTSRPSFAAASRIGRDVRRAFLAERCDEVYVAYNVFRSALVHTPEIRRLLPLDLAAIPPASGPAAANAILQPDADALAAQLGERLVDLWLFEALMHNAAGSMPPA